MSNVITEINSTVNEIYAKSIVTQKFLNPTDNPLDLKIYLIKNDHFLFSSFTCKIGDSIEFKSKVIKKANTEIIQTDDIDSKNAGILINQDSSHENRIIIDLGKIPPKTKVIFISEFLNLIEVSRKYEFELFGNLPIFNGIDSFYQNSELTGNINIITKNEIINIEKNISMKDLKIIDEKYLNEGKNKYTISYKIDKLPEFSLDDDKSIPSSKIYFYLKEDNMNEPIIYFQESSLNENNYIIHYRYKKEKEEEEKLNPSLFIFLLDKIDRIMEGYKKEIVHKALLLFINSLPIGSYYQIIGFDTQCKVNVYDKIPKEKNNNNINMFDIISDLLKPKLTVNLSDTNIKGPLKYIYDFDKIYEEINLPRNIILLSDGESLIEEEGLNLIKQNNSKYTFHAISIGNNYNEDLIKKIAIVGKGNFDFYKNLEYINKNTVSEFNKANNCITNLKIKSNLDDDNVLGKNFVPNIIKDNSIVNFYYIVNKNIDKINIKIEYDYIKQNKKIEKNYEIIPEKLENGDDLSKIIMDTYIKNQEKEILRLAIKYQIFHKNTSLLAQVNSSKKTSEEIKSNVLYDEEKNIIKQFIPKNSNIDLLKRQILLRFSKLREHEKISSDEESEEEQFKPNKNKPNDLLKQQILLRFRDLKMHKDKSSDKDSEEEEEEKNFEMNSDLFILKTAGTQNKYRGFWEENIYTKKIKEKYQNEYDLITGIKNKNMNDVIALTILVIYYMNKENPKIASQLGAIVRAKKFIFAQTNDSYENIIKEIGLN